MRQRGQHGAPKRPTPGSAGSQIAKGMGSTRRTLPGLLSYALRNLNHSPLARSARGEIERKKRAVVTGILDDLAEDVQAALGGELRNATYWRSEIVGDDGYGNPVYDWVAYTCEGMRSNYDAQYAGQSGIPRTNVRIEILASSLNTTPRTLDRILIEDEWWVITQVETDPATAVWLCQCQASSDPNT
jgi:hypothetical protein